MKNRKEAAQRNKQIRQELQWLLRRSRQHGGSIAIISILGLLAALMGLGSNVASKYLVDGITTHNKYMLLASAGIMGVLMVGSLVLNAWSSRISTRIRVRLRNTNQQQIYKRILRADWQALEPYRSGDLLQRLNSDVGIVSEGIIGFLPGLFSLGLRLLGAVAIMLYFDPILALMVLLATPATFLLSNMIMRPLRRHDQTVKDLGSRIMSFQEDSFRNLTSIKAFAISDRFAGSMGKLQDEYARETLAMNKTQVRISVITSLASTFFVGVCLAWGAWLLWRNQLTVGSLTMFLQLMSVLRSSFSGILTMSQRTVNLATSAGRVMAVEELTEEPADVPAGLEQEQELHVHLKQASFSYQSGDVVLQPFDFTANPGDTIAVTGPSGEGKTTLLRLLLGLIRPGSGTAELVGEKTYPLCAGTRTMFAYVPQGNSIFAGTVAENLRLVKPEATDEELEKALEVACALDFVRQLPGGLEYHLGAGGRGISEGQAQRLAVARALLKRAPILLLDEATSAMDVKMEGRLLQNLRESGMVHTCILVTHRPASAEFCDRAYEICDGVVSEVSYEG